MREIIRLESTAGTGYNYYTTRNKKQQTDKLQLDVGLLPSIDLFNPVETAPETDVLAARIVGIQ